VHEKGHSLKCRSNYTRYDTSDLKSQLYSMIGDFRPDTKSGIEIKHSATVIFSCYCSGIFLNNDDTTICNIGSKLIRALYSEIVVRQIKPKMTANMVSKRNKISNKG